jgi:hypothetical protein
MDAAEMTCILAGLDVCCPDLSGACQLNHEVSQKLILIFLGILIVLVFLGEINLIIISPPGQKNNTRGQPP